ncbi:MAG: NAD(P)-dependent oxidoreductase, partial [Coprococcus sp.]
SIHCPLFPETEGMIDRSAIGRMKKTTFIINTARGGCIVEKDLADALNEERIAGAAVDVIAQEPMAADNPLLTAKNVIITPHIAWAPKEVRERLLNIAGGNIEAFLNGKPVNTV